jgi:hypothetical protein
LVCATDYKGAFGSSNWLSGWSWLDQAGLLAETTTSVHCGSIDSDETWSAGDDHLLTCQTFVEDGVTLTIEAGATIKSLSDDGSGLAPALVINRGGKIIADGTADAPITFTSAIEGIDDNPQTQTWGGLIINGNAPISNSGGEAFVEGLVGVPYGGNDPADDSGVLRYVRVWYGGSVIGQDNEINGITLAGVGNGTTVDHCEVAYNKDDGFEMFGGTVDLTYCSVVRVGDDSFDTDNGYQGRGQFLSVVRGADSDRCMEMDNKTDSNLDSQPRSHPIFSNMTCAGASGANDLAKLREGTGGDHRNLIMVDGAGDGIENEDNGSETVTQDLSAGTYPDYLYVSSNTLFWNVTTPFKDTMSDLGFTYQEADPGLNIDYTTVVDLTPDPFGPAYDMVDDVASDWFVQTDYKGAFGSSNWLSGWSWLDQAGLLAETTEECVDTNDPTGDGVLNVIDIVSTVAVILGNAEWPNSCSEVNADINGDGVVNIIDVVQMVNLVVGGRVSDATSAELVKTSDLVLIKADGYLGAVQMTLTHGDDFDIKLTDDAMVADYRTIDNSTTLIIVRPESEELFTADGRFEISEVIVANSANTIDVSIATPNAFGLSAAYPNPFNPTTSVALSLPNDGYVSVTVYNAIGQVVGTIADGYMTANVYDFSWNASSVPSGMYFIRAEAGNSVDVQKVMLLK